MRCKHTSNLTPITTKRPTLQSSKKQTTDVLQPTAHHQGSKTPFTEVRWIGPYIIENVLPNNNYLVRKIGTNKTQVLHRMKCISSHPTYPPLDLRITWQERKPDLKISLKHDDLYVGTLECEYEEPIFDAKNINATPPNSPQVPVQSELTTIET